MVLALAVDIFISIATNAELRLLFVAVCKPTPLIATLSQIFYNINLVLFLLLISRQLDYFISFSLWVNLNQQEQP